MKRNIVFLIDTLETGGAEKSLLEITSRFKKYNPIFFQLYQGDTLLSDFESAGITVKQFNLNSNYRFKEVSAKILPDIEKLNAVLIHSTLFRSDMVARHLQIQTELPLINSLVNNSYSKQRFKALSFFGKLKLLAIQLWDGFTARNVNCFISNSNTIKESNAKALFLNKEKIKVIYRGRNLHQFENLNNERIEQEKIVLGLDGKKIFLNVSRLLDRKGQLDLLRAFCIVNAQNKDTVLLIAGEGSYRSVLEQEIRKLDLVDSVKLLGNRNDVPVLLKLADCFVFPSHYEGLPGALIEAMFSRTPIIASSIPENLECINDEMAFLFPVGNIELLTDQMFNAIGNINLMGMTSKAHAFALKNFEINSIAAQYEALYDDLISR